MFKKIFNTIILFSFIAPYFPTPIANAQTFTVQVVGTTNTQATLKYTAPNSNACTVEVSESSSLSPLVHDVNPSFFAGSNLDTRESALSSGTTRIFVIGKRMVEKGLNGNNYSRALQTNTTHYYRITCGAAIATGSFATANIPFGMNYSDGIQNNPEDRSGYMYPTVDKTDRNFKFVDPKTGTLHKIMGLTSDGLLVNNGTSFHWSSAGFHEFCAPALSANGFYHCAIINDWAPLLYAIHPQTGEVRFLGSLYYWGQSYGLQEGVNGCGGNAGIAWDITDANIFYCGGKLASNGELVLLKITYTGNDKASASGLNGGIPVAAPLSIVNLTPAPNTITKQVKDFDPTFDITKFGCGIGGSNMGGYIGLGCARGIQDSFGWIGAYDLGNKLPLSAGGTGKLHAFVPHYAQTGSRWCTNHTGEFLGGAPVIAIHNQFTKGGLGASPYRVTLTNSLPGGVAAGSLTTAKVTSAWDPAWGAQPSGWEPGEPLALELDHYLMDVQVGDVFVHGGEYMKIAEKISSTEWVFKRGIGKDQSALYPKPHAAGVQLMAMCNGSEDGFNTDPGLLGVTFWDFVNAPRGGNPNLYKGNFGSHPVSRGGYRVSEGQYAYQDLKNPQTWSMIPNGYLNLSPNFAGAILPAWGNSFEKHSTMPYHASNWFLDFHPFTGGITAGSDADTKSLGGNLYQYFYNGLDTPHYGGDGLNRKQAATFAFNGNYQMVDISGPGSVIGTGGDYNYTYCVANKAGECVAGSALGDIYFNVPELTPGRRFCNGQEFYDGSTNVCIGNVPTIGFGTTQTKIVTGNEAIRVLSRAFSYAHQSGTGNVKVTPDGSWVIMNSYLSGYPIFLVKVPPIPTSDGVDRTTFVRTPITVTPPTGKGITQAKILFGYEEFGKPNQYYCTSRREACVSTTSTIVDSNPFSYIQTDSYTNVPCTTSCSITLPVLPMRTAYFKVSYLNSSGVEVATDNGVVVERYVAALGSASTNVVSSPTTPTPTPTIPTPVQPPVQVIDTTAPIISNVTTSNITSNSATITWTTDEPSSSYIEYGLTSAYGASATDGTPATSHALTFSGLTPGTKYNYRVSSEDTAGNERVSSNQIFTTQAAPVTPPPTTPAAGSTSGTFSSWSSKKSLTVNKSQVEGSHTDFPLLVSFTDPDLKYTSNGGKVSKTDGTDIFFTNSADTKLSHEIEKYDPATGQLIAWVKLPSLSSSADTTLNLYFGNASASDQQDKTGVWDTNYKGVWHLDGGTNLGINDATGSNNIASKGTFVPVDSGKIGGGVDNNGSSHMRLNGSPMDGLTSFTLDTWINHDTGASGQAFWSDWSTPQVLWRYEGSSDLRFLVRWSDATSADLQYTPSGYANGSWNKVTITYDGSTIRTYGNGNAGNTTSASGKTVANHSGSNVQKIGGGTTGSEEYWDGSIDEIRISNVARSTDWIKTEYNNQNSPSSFVSVGTTQNVQQTTTEIPPKTAETLGPPPPTGSPAVTFQSVASPNVSSGGGGGSSSSRTTTTTSNTTTTQTTTTQTSTGSISLPRDLVFGAKGSDVTLLQKTLVSSGYLPSDSATGYFGPLTLSAIKKYQQDKGLAGPGDRGWGNVGPQTRAHFAKLSGTVQTTNTLTPTQKAAIQAQINSLLTLVTKLMAQLQALQGR